ncbi:MAG: sulfatase [Planctomycetota bacterium]|nr:sulfatase [Planctomycetota bacterium]
MKNNTIIPASVLLLAGLFLFAPNSWASDASRAELPNIVIVFTDDQGWGDLSCYGSKDIPTPHIDRLANEGMRFTDFYTSQPVCSAARASLLTGCYSNRVGISGALAPSSKIGLHPEELTIAEVVKPLGYATACYGKWHLGHHPEFLPTAQGFDEYCGIPYSNDMWPGHPESPKAWPPLPWYEQEKSARIIEDLDDQETITSELTRRAVDFIDRNADGPFLLYVPHSMPHVPLATHPRFRQTTKFGPYGDVIREIDDSVGQIVAALEKNNILDNTLVIFTSDNGPWLSYGDHAGTTGGLREGKGTTFEGGVRVPFVARFPGVIPAGKECNTPCMTIDILPTLVELTGGTSPDKEIDGVSILPQLRGDVAAAPPHKALYFWYHRGDLEAMRMGQWKLHFPHNYRSLEGRPPGNNGIPAKYNYKMRTELALYDLESDPHETKDLSETNAGVAVEMMGLAIGIRQKLGDRLGKIEGTDVRKPGKLVSDK